MIGETIRRIRKSQGLTLKDLSERTGYSPQHIQLIETGTHVPRITLAIDIADVLGVSLDELVGREFGEYKSWVIRNKAVLEKFIQTGKVNTAWLTDERNKRYIKRYLDERGYTVSIKYEVKKNDT